MEVRVLRYFLEVAREGSITHAAKRLHISQPTLSKQLKDLESQLGKRLFTRSSFSVHLTDEGVLLRKRAEDIVDMVDKTEEEFKALGEITGGDIHVGCAESEGIKYVARCMKSIRERYPGIQSHLYSGDTSDLEGRLEQGFLDFAVICQAVDFSRYNYLELPWVDTWGVVLRKDSPLAEKKAVTVEDLLGQPLIVSRQGLREDMPRLFGEKVDQLNVTSTMNLSYNGTIFAREGLGCVLTFDKLMNIGDQDDLCFRPLSPRLETRLYVIWKKYQVFSPAADLLLREMKEAYGVAAGESS